MEINADLVKMARLVLKNYQSAIAEATSPYGLTPLEGLLITFYFVNPSQDTPSSAVKALHVSKGNVSTSLASLLQRGFLEKRNDAKDHRTSHLRLTEKAKPLCTAITKARNDYFAHLLKGLSPEELSALEKDIAILLRNIDHDKNRE
jgi:DNA-binding MarR family transcriptional regulator